MVPNLDYETLRLFLTIFQLHSLTNATQRLGMSPSKGSRLLKQLRTAFGDPLFSRTVTGVIPTMRAQQILPDVQRIVEQYEAAFETKQFHQPATLSRIFRIAALDRAIVSFIFPSLGKIRSLVPNIGFDFRAMREIHTDYHRALADGIVDLVICPDPPVSEDFRTRRICTETYVFIVSPDHPLAKLKAMRPLVRSDFEGYRFTKMLLNPFINIDNNHWSDKDKDLPVRTSEFSLWSPSLLLTWAAVMADSKLVAAVPLQFALQIAKSSPFVILGRPSTTAVVHPTMLWHKRTDGDQAFQWFRGMLINDHQRIDEHYPVDEIDF